MAVLQTSSMKSGTLCKQFHHLDVSTSKKRRTSPLHFTIQGLTSKLQKNEQNYTVMRTEVAEA